MLVGRTEGGHPPWGIKNPQQGGNPAGGRTNQKVYRENVAIIARKNPVGKGVAAWFARICRTHARPLE